MENTVELILRHKPTHRLVKVRKHWFELEGGKYKITNKPSWRMSDRLASYLPQDADR
jgi:hypothetical protein